MESATGSAALEQLETTAEVDLLLNDVMLPGGMNGRVLATEVVRRTPGIKVLYMSGYTENAIAHHGRLDSDAELLQKPFRRADLARAVREVLDGRLAWLSRGRASPFSKRIIGGSPAKVTGTSAAGGNSGSR